MELLNNLMLGFGVALTLPNLGFMLIGITLGVLIGVLPGLGGANGVAILLPLMSIFLLGILDYMVTNARVMETVAVADLAAAVTPIGLGCGRLGNFINGELYGRATDVEWCMVFPA